MLLSQNGSRESADTNRRAEVSLLRVLGLRRLPAFTAKSLWRVDRNVCNISLVGHKKDVHIFW